MDRDAIESFFEEAKKVRLALEHLPWRQAVPAMRALDEMRDLIGEELPGGHYGKCIGCGDIKGNDEMVSAGDEDLCRDCYAAADKVPAAAEQ